MNGQNGWYTDQQQQQYAAYPAYPGQARPPQQQPNQQQAYSDQHAQQTSDPFTGEASPSTVDQPQYQQMNSTAQSQRYQYGAGMSIDTSSFLAAPSYPSSSGNYYGQAQTVQQSPTTSGYANAPRRENVGSRCSNGMVQFHQTQQSPYMQQQLAQQPYNGSGTQAPWEYSNTYAAAPQHRPSLSAGPSRQQQQQQQQHQPSHQQYAYPQSFASPSNQSTPQQPLRAPDAASQYAMKSPYAPSTGTRERLAMSQSPISDVFQSGGQPAGRTFNLMAGLERPTPNPPLRRVSAQIDSSHGDPFTGQRGSFASAQTENLTLSGHWNASSSNGHGQSQQQWPAAPQTARPQQHPQNVGSSSTLASWNSTKPYSNMQPSPVDSDSFPHPQRNPSIGSSPHLSNNSHANQVEPVSQHRNSVGASVAPAYNHGGGVPQSMLPGSYPAPLCSSGSSLDAAWGLRPSRAGTSTRAPASNEFMAPSQPMPHMAEPGSPSLLVARNHSLPSRQHAQPPMHSLASSSSASSTLEMAVSASPKVSSLPPQPPLQAPIKPATASSISTSALPTEKSKPKSVKRRWKPKMNAEAGPAMANAPLPAAANLQSNRGFQAADGALPQYALPSELFARAPCSQVMPPPPPTQSIAPMGIRRSKELQTPSPPPPFASQTLSVQESPDPLNLLSPHAHFSLWQQQHSAPSPPPQPYNPNRFAQHHHQHLTPQQHDIAMVRAQAGNFSPSSKPKDAAPADKPKRKRTNKVKVEQPAPTPTFRLSIDDSSLPSSFHAGVPQESRPPKPKKPKKPKLENNDQPMPPQVTVDISLPLPNADSPFYNGHSYTSSAHDSHLEQKETKRKKKSKRKSKSFSDLVNEIVEDSDSGMDAEGSDWDDLNILEHWDAVPPNDAESLSEGPKSSAKMSNGPVKSSHRKMPIAKLQGLIEDLFEADDSLPDHDALQGMLPGQSLSAAADPFFEIIESHSSTGGESRSILVLRTAALQKLLKLIVKCSRPQTEIAALTARTQTATESGLSTIPNADITRLLAILERTARIGEDFDPFPSQVNRGAASEPASPTKPKKARKLDRQGKSPSKIPEPVQTPDGNGGDLDAAHGATPVGDRDIGSADQELEKVNATFSVVDHAILAAECSLGFLTGDVLPKQILSEDHIRVCFEAVKTCLEKVILPFIEACSGSSATDPHPVLVALIDVLAPEKARKKKATAANAEEPTSSTAIICRNNLSDLFAHLCSVLFFVQRMVRMPSIALSDSIVISAVYLALGPFFVLEPEAASGGASSETAKAAARGRYALASLGGANSMKTLRLPALNLLRSIFSKAPDQRQWMIEEILTSLTKLTDMKKNRRQYSLRNGKGIHSINALLLQLIQAASHGVASYAKSTADRLSKGKDADGEEDNNRIEMEEAEADSNRMQALEVVIEAFNATSGSDANDAREAEIAIWRRGLEGANQSARSIAGYLMQRIGQTKVAKSSQEMSYAYVVESLIQDLLSALFLPEWPAAALMLSSFCRVFGTYLEDPKSHPDAKGVALEQLSLVAARLRQSQLQLQPAPIKALRSPNGEKSPQLGDRDPDNSALQRAEPQSPRKRPKWTMWDYLSMLRALREGDRYAIQEFVKAYKFISRFLVKAGSEDMSMEGALEFLLVQAEGDLATAWAKAEEDKQALSDSMDDTAVQIAKLQHFREELDAAMLTLSELDPTLGDTSLADFNSDEKMLEKATDLSERVLVASSSMISYNMLKDLLVEGLNNPIIANRSKALRGIDRIAQVDPDLLDEDAMRSAIEVRLRDSSNTVRESAVALFGSYVLRKPQYIPKYYKQLAVRILDTGLSVRKRMVRLLKSLHEATDDQHIRIDACARIVRCINDEDTVVQDMAILTIGEMWLDLDVDARRLYTRRRGTPVQSTPTPASAADATEAKDGDGEEPSKPADETNGRADGPRPTEEEPTEETEADKKVTDTIEIIMAVADVIKERPSPLEEVFRRLFKDKSEAEAAELHAKLQKLGDSMIDSLVESSGASDVDTVKRIRIVQLLVSTNPAILTISKAKLLLPYLKAAQTSEEVQIMDLLLRIFRSCLPHMPKTALAFAESLEKSLRPLVNRPPPKAGLHLLQELIACYCAVITTHTHNFKLLIQTLKACFVRVQAMRQMALKGQKVEDNKAWSTLMSLTASLCEHANFDDIRKKHPETASDIAALSKGPLIDAVSKALLDIHKTGSEAVRSVSLQNLGFIFRAYPTLMTQQSMTAMMDDIFASGLLQDRATLLKIILDFLSADSSRRNPDNAVVNVGTGRRKPEKPDAGSVDMTILVGNTETFADTGVGSAMMQRYSEDVLKATLEISNPSLQRTAIDILRFTVLQGLSHPIQCVPYLVSLETLEDRKIRSRAMELHSHLASKHASLVHARFLDTARSAFSFQLQQTSAQALRGFRVDSMPTAVLGAWYSLLRDRRATRLDFLKQIVKALDVNTAASECDMQEVLFTRFMADNLATLDYKTMEELFIVIGELRSILAVSGMQVLYMIQPHLPKQEAPVGAPVSTPLPPMDGTQTPPPPPGVGAVPGNDLISPFGMSRNPWLSGEWQLQLASDGPQSFSGTVDPTQIFGQPPPFAAMDGDAALSSTSQPTNPSSGTKDDEAAAAGSKTQVDPVTMAHMSIISGTALLLRNHLKQLYGLSEARCAKFNPSKKQSAGADKPATMRALSDPMQAALDLGAMPFGLEEVKNDEDAQKQMLAYAAMVENEGTMMEPEDPDALDDLAL
ncbi:related to proline-rich protein required for meiotic chromosome condensation and synapsis [Ustilago bromivora]|uniref:Sister chromatid cohesion protein n=1 Tax=Ustilago bromivora TaxID=307758 RepID=A0A1K0GBD4_9BASI|nr:related to proline-rich protein required for meiotic chromosome condensation and synapsis [Ustilago bromivora]